MEPITAKKRRKKSKASLILVVLIVCSVFSALGWKFGSELCRKLLFPNRYEEFVTRYAADNDLDKYLVMAVIKNESNFVPDAHSGKASGLMQLTDETGKWVGEKLGIKYSDINLNDPQCNIQLGCYYLKYLIDHYDNIDTALAAYNGGMGNVSKWLDDEKYSKDGKTLYNIPFRETREYVKKVNDSWLSYRNMYGR